MGVYLYTAGALVLLAMGAEAIVRTIGVEIAARREALGDPATHGSAARVRAVFRGRLAIALPEPVLALGIGGAAFWAAICEGQQTLRLTLPLLLLVWLQFRMFRFNAMPPPAVLAMFLFIAGQLFWPASGPDPLILEFEESLKPNP